MKFTLDWLKDHLDTSENLNTITDTLTNIGLEIESVEDKSEIFKNFTVAKVLKAEKHPDADKLKVCQVETINGNYKLCVVLQMQEKACLEFLHQKIVTFLEQTYI